MGADEYLTQIINKYAVNEAGVKACVETVYPTIQQWAGAYLIEAVYSGSIAKGTAITLATDADVFVSLSSSTPNTLSEIYNSLYVTLSNAGYQALKQNVSIGISVRGYKIDIVPGKRQSQYGGDHSLYKNKTSTWTKTNISTHISQVANSYRLNEIKLTKIWRQLNSLDFPSFYLELAVMDCLSGRLYKNISENFWEVLRFLKDDFITRRYADPANTNNIISDDLSNNGKQTVRQVAKIARTKKHWSEIIW